MLKVGFVVSRKNNERRRAILPKEMGKLKCVDNCLVEEGYGEALYIADEAYVQAGATIAPRAQVLQSDVLVDVKLGDAEYMDVLPPKRTLFGWAHATQKTEFTTACMRAGHTVVAWEEMDEGNRNAFYRNRELAGEAAVLQALSYTGKAPYDMRAAVLGRGNTAKGALRVLHGLGANVDMYGSKQEALFLQKIGEYDLLVICVMWDTDRKNRLLTNEDIPRLKKGAMIVDVSADGNLAIEFGHTTTIDAPVFMVDDILYYAVDNTPSLFAATATKYISRQVGMHLDALVTGKADPLLQKATVIREGKIVDEKTRRYRQRMKLFV